MKYEASEEIKALTEDDFTAVDWKQNKVLSIYMQALKDGTQAVVGRELTLKAATFGQEAVKTVLWVIDNAQMMSENTEEDQDEAKEEKEHTLTIQEKEAAAIARINRINGEVTAVREEEKPLWVENVEKEQSKLYETDVTAIGWYPYRDPESGEEVYWKVRFSNGTERAYRPITDKRTGIKSYAKAGYGGYTDIPIYTPSETALSLQTTVMICQMEHDAETLAKYERSAISIYKMTKATFTSPALQKLLAEKKIVLVTDTAEDKVWEANAQKCMKAWKVNEYAIVAANKECILAYRMAASDGQAWLDNEIAEGMRHRPVEVIPKRTGFGLSLIDEAAPMQLLTSTSGSVSQTMVNCLEILKKDECLKIISFAKNTMSGEIIIKDQPWQKIGNNFDESDLRQIRTRMELMGIHKKDVIDDAIATIADERSFDPVKEILEKLPEWDGKDRYGELFPRYLGADRTELTRKCTKVFANGAIARTYDPGCKFEQILVTIGTQGIGKSELFRRLAMSPDLFTDSVGDIGDKEVFGKIRGMWIIELGEMTATQGNSARSVEQIKQFVSTRYDRHRDLYEKHAKQFPRRCVMTGTSNPIECLPDDSTGNRRFLPIDCHSEKRKIGITEDPDADDFIAQFWAQALHDWNTGNVTLYLDDNDPDCGEELQAFRELHTPGDTRVGQIQDYLDTYRPEKTCVREIWHEALGMKEIPRKWESREIGLILDQKIEGYKRKMNASNPTEYFPPKYGYTIKKSWNPLTRKMEEYEDEEKVHDGYGNQRAWLRTADADELLAARRAKDGQSGGVGTLLEDPEKTQSCGEERTSDQPTEKPEDSQVFETETIGQSKGEAQQDEREAIQLELDLSGKKESACELLDMPEGSDDQSVEAVGWSPD